ncbi:hypothetical protein EBT31_04640 [bacterium]|nr:hypothetical protein [bacterium]
MAIVAMSLCFPVGALAIDLGQTELQTAGQGAEINVTGSEGSLPTLIGLFINLALGLLSVLLLIYFVYAGFLWMTAQGDEKQVKKAKDVMANAVVGLIITLSANAIVFFFIAQAPGADVLLSENAQQTFESTGVTSTDLLDNIGTMISIVLNLLGVVLLVLFIYAGILWMTAQGDGKQVDKAKSIMKNALIGLILTLLAYSISSFIIGRLSGERAAGGWDYSDSIIGGS